MSHHAPTTSGQALLLVGSPKPSGSASAAFAASVSSRLESRGWTTRTERITPSFTNEDHTRELLDAIAQSDLVVLSFPIYVDTLPAPVLRLLEAWRDKIADAESQRLVRARLAVLTQCGFPEARHCDVAVEVCRCFAEETGVEWAGALAFGMGPSISGGSVEKSPLARVISQLDAAVDELAAGNPIPEVAREAFARPVAPAWTYPLVGGFVWSREARRHGCSEPLTLRRYAQ